MCELWASKIQNNAGNWESLSADVIANFSKRWILSKRTWIYVKWNCNHVCEKRSHKFGLAFQNCHLLTVILICYSFTFVILWHVSYLRGNESKLLSCSDKISVYYSRNITKYVPTKISLFGMNIENKYFVAKRVCHITFLTCEIYHSLQRPSTCKADFSMF